MNSHSFLPFQRYQPEIRFKDIDVAGIVNNAVYLSLFEQSRIKFFEGLFGQKWDWNTSGMVVARHEIDYKWPLRMTDDVEILTWIQAFGTKSLTAAYEVRIREDSAWRITAKAQSVMVSFDHIKGVSKPWPIEWVDVLNRVGKGYPLGE